MIRGTRRATVALCVLLTACGDGPTTPGGPDAAIAVLSGDGQFAQAGQDLASPLVVRVTDRSSGDPLQEIRVAWSVVEGSASFPSGSVSVTDASGVASVTARVGGTPGEVRIRAEVEGGSGASADFTAFVIDRPTLTSLSREDAGAGETIALRGTNFSPVPTHNVVLFSGIRGRVLVASAGELQVEVPTCLPTRTVEVTAQLGSLVSGPLPLRVLGGEPQPLAVPTGGYVDVDDREGFTCVTLGGEGGSAYLLVVASTGTVGAARYGFDLRGLSERGDGIAPSTEHGWAAPSKAVGPSRSEVDPATEFENRLRGEEEALVSAVPGGGARATDLPSRVPVVGERRTFNVLNAERTFDQVTAVVRFVGAKAALYVDEAAPEGGLTPDDLAAFSAGFDEVIEPTVTAAYGRLSDLDGNERIAILFTATVNQLTPRGSDGFIGGFFFGLDLLDQEGSNHAEVFYALVPDPLGTLSDPHPKTQVLEVTPAILAHELQHMIHFNERVLVRGASGTEALWLSEGLAQMSEELVARSYYERGDDRAGDRFRSGNLLRARRYLGSPSSSSLIVATGQGSLEERGAGWLHTLYLWDRLDGDQTLGTLTRTTRTGVGNVEAVSGRAWGSWFTDWAGALYLDDLGAGPYPGEYPSVDLRALLSNSTGSYPLSPEVLGFSDFKRVGSLWSSSPRHYIVVPPGGGRVMMRLGGEGGAAAPTDSGLLLRVVRLF